MTQPLNRPVMMMEESVNNDEGGRSINILKCLDIVNHITNLLLGAIACCAISAAALPAFRGSMYNIHVVLVVMGYILMMSQAVLTLNRSSWSRLFSPQQKTTMHWIMQVGGATLAVAGSALAISTSSWRSEKSVHGILGIVAMSLTLLSLCGGVIHLLSSSRLTRTIHGLCGLLALTLAFINLIFGFYKLYYPTPTFYMLAFMTVLAILGILGTTLLRIFNVYR